MRINFVNTTDRINWTVDVFVRMKLNFEEFPLRSVWQRFNIGGNLDFSFDDFFVGSEIF